MTAAPEQRPVALITGASRGVGRALAVQLGEAGYHVYPCARTQGGLEEAAHDVRSSGGRATPVALDLADARQIEALAAEIAGRNGRLDLLVHAAAVRETPAPAAHLEPSIRQKTFAVNCDAFAHLLRCFDPLVRLAAEAPRGAGEAAPRRPAVMLLSDETGTPFGGAYAASKAAAESLAKSYALESETFVDVIIARLLPTRTALRASVSPGADPGLMQSPQEAAARLARLLLERPATSSNQGDYIHVRS